MKLGPAHGCYDPGRYRAFPIALCLEQWKVIRSEEEIMRDCPGVQAFSRKTIPASSRGRRALLPSCCPGCFTYYVALRTLSLQVVVLRTVLIHWAEIVQSLSKRDHHLRESPPLAAFAYHSFHHKPQRQSPADRRCATYRHPPSLPNLNSTYRVRAP